MFLNEVRRKISALKQCVMSDIESGRVLWCSFDSFWCLSQALVKQGSGFFVKIIALLSA